MTTRRRSGRDERTRDAGRRAGRRRRRGACPPPARRGLDHQDRARPRLRHRREQPARLPAARADRCGPLRRGHDPRSGQRQRQLRRRPAARRVRRRRRRRAHSRRPRRSGPHRHAHRRGAPRSSITPLATAPARRRDRSRAHRRDRARRRRTGGAGPDDHHRPCPLERHRLGRPARLPAPCAPDRRTPAGLPHRGPLRPQRRPDQRPARPRRQRLPRRRPARHRPAPRWSSAGVASSPPSPPTSRSAPTSWASSSRTTGSARPCSTG